MDDILVLGLGNLLLGDEAVGIHALRRLMSEHQYPPEIAMVDGGTLGLDLLPLFQQYQRILMIDAIALEQPPGTVQLYRDQDIHEVLTSKLSLHHLNITDVLALAALLGQSPSEIVLIGVVPECIELKLELSPAVAASLPKVLETATSVLADWLSNPV